MPARRARAALAGPGSTAGAARLARARVALGVVFVLNGLVLASWVPHVAGVKAGLGLSDGSLGLVLLAMAAGAVAALPLAGWLVARAGSQRVAVAAAAGLAAALPLPVLAPHPGLTALGLALLGAANATLDVAMNAQAVAIETASGRPMLSSFHGLFSAGGLVGAALASAVMAAGVADRAHVLGVALAGVGFVLLIRRALLPVAPDPGLRIPVFAWPPRSLAGLGALTFCALLAEGAIGDWSAVYLGDTLGGAPALGGAGFAAFSLAMAAGRFAGDRLMARVGPVRLLRASGALAAVGLAGSLVLGHPGAAVAGLALVGLGLANTVPVLFGAAGRVAAVPATTALAAVATTGYGGFLVGPPLIGLAAEALGLSGALAIVVAACALLALGARWMPGPHRPAACAADAAPDYRPCGPGTSPLGE